MTTALVFLLPVASLILGLMIGLAIAVIWSGLNAGEWR
jgi:hypothetical protein